MLLRGWLDIDLPVGSDEQLLPLHHLVLSGFFHFLNVFLLIYEFSCFFSSCSLPCPAGKGEWVSSCVGALLLAKVSPEHICVCTQSVGWNIVCVKSPTSHISGGF